MTTAAIDHLVVAANTLDEGTVYVEDLLGVKLEPGGKHERMGTHNRLLRLGEKLYLEVIAIDPKGGRPFQSRWFGLDSPFLQKAIREHPRLVTWVARIDDIEKAAKRSQISLGNIHSMRRGDFQWKITITSDGRPAANGIVPMLVTWLSAQHPADSLEDQGCVLEQLTGFHPNPETLEPTLKMLGLDRTISVKYSLSPNLSARIRTPNGIKIVSA